MSHLVIVGGSSGIGREVGELLQRMDHRVTVLPRSTSPEVAMAAVHAVQPITAVFFCQRFRGEGDPWEGEIAASLTYTKRVMEWVGTHLYSTSVVVMSSVAAVSVEEEQPVGYHMAKAALSAMVRYYAVTLGSRRIGVNEILPGLTPKEEAWGFYDSHKALGARYEEITPMKRVCLMRDIAEYVNFLISGKAGYQTGQTITLDGGIGLRSAWALARMITPELKDVPVTQRYMVPKNFVVEAK